MIATGGTFEPLPSLLIGDAGPACRVCVTIPARNEAEALAICLQSFAQQKKIDGTPLPLDCFEILLLLNNCDDGSAHIARSWSRHHPEVRLHVLEVTLSACEAHVGTARRLLMDTAFSRLQGRPDAAILTTDADTCVAADWIAQTLRALDEGADVVGGWVRVAPAELEKLPGPVRSCYERDRLYAQAVAHLEALLDPREEDPWPRHLDHFGSSLGCSTEAYAAAGGMPAVTPLEDEAFIDRVRQAGLRLRHEPRVVVWTSARMKGRATVGFAGQFRLWDSLADATSHTVQSAAFLEHRFRTLRQLRCAFLMQDASHLQLPTEWWQTTFQDALDQQPSCEKFLAAVYCDVFIAESFVGKREEPVNDTIATLRRRICELEPHRSSTKVDMAAQPSLDRSSVVQ